MEVAAPVKYFLDNFVDIIAYLLSALRNCRFEADWKVEAHEIIIKSERKESDSMKEKLMLINY